LDLSSTDIAVARLEVALDEAPKGLGVQNAEPKRTTFGDGVSQFLEGVAGELAIPSPQTEERDVRESRAPRAFVSGYLR
jgi:hypothetical protein